MFGLATLAFVSVAEAWGQTGENVMTLHDCMEFAISNSTKMRIQQAAKGDAQIDRRDAALALFTPQINAQTYAYYNFGRSIDPQTTRTSTRPLSTTTIASAPDMAFSMASRR
ncbi:MAG: hypothetical protein J6P50_03370 [Bacteroidales bacterium]|nr:hypothetical protein [Bacteroidales bacterium]